MTIERLFFTSLAVSVLQRNVPRRPIRYHGLSHGQRAPEAVHQPQLG